MGTGTQLLSTKLYIPQEREKLITRSHLLSRLDEYSHRKLILISAPAGFGKTTLTSSWILQSNKTASWVSLDDGDNDLFRFWSYITAAIEKEVPFQGGTLSEVLEGNRLSGPNQMGVIKGHITGLINEISLSKLEKEEKNLVLVLDDYHLITNQTIHDSLSFLIDHLPRALQIVILTRSDPPLPLPRLRARSQLAEFRTRDLHFSVEEMSIFLQEIMRVNLTQEEFNILGDRTEGWIAGLQMAGLAIQSLGSSKKGERDSSSILNFIREFSGENTFIFDYLAEEVFNKLDQNDQNFLMSTSILETLDNGVCGAVSGREDSQQVLERLANANLFVSALDDKRRWYRYHQLFRDFLQEKLRQTQPEKLALVHGLASAWFEDHEQIGKAIDHAIWSADFDRAANLIQNIANTGIGISEPSSLLRWLQGLPKEIIYANPVLGLSYATTLLGLGHLDEVENYLVEVEKVIPSYLKKNYFDKEDGVSANGGKDPTAPLPDYQKAIFLGRSIAIRAVVACYQGKAAQAVDLSNHALERLPDKDFFWRGVMAINIALNLSELVGSENRLNEASEVLAKAALESQAHGDDRTALFALGRRGDIHKIQGKLRAAASDYENAITIGRKRRTHLPSVGISLVGQGSIFYEWNELVEAEKSFLEAIQLSRKGGDIDVIGESQVLLARLKISQRDLFGTNAALEEANLIARQSNISWIAGQADTYQAYSWLQQEKTDLIDAWLANNKIHIGDDIGYRREKEFTMLARAQIFRNEYDKAQKLLEWLEGVTKKAGMVTTWMEVLVLQSINWYEQRNQARAIKIMDTALSNAEKEGYVRLFLDEGPAVEEMLRILVSQGKYITYAGKLLAAFNEENTSPISGLDVEQLVEPLTERERQVLALLSSGASNREIAETLVLALGTVKKHINNIYGKMGVGSRTQAVKRGRELKLL